jgi:2-C-methyl-D-erythritol 4-phosphate cytidylyltransferase/2-C-methyl-D-erythritol 2,4-cyclodiphosphate synthase
MPKVVAIILAAGEGKRFTSQNDQPTDLLASDFNRFISKQYYLIDGKPALIRAAQVFIDAKKVDAVKFVINQRHLEQYNKSLQFLDLGDCALLPVSFGGEERHLSVLNALNDLSTYSPDNVLIHDAARPYITKALIERVLDALEVHKAVVPAIPSENTLKEIDNNKVLKTIDRTKVFQVQTPQGFDYRKLLELSLKNNSLVTDDAKIFEYFAEEVFMVEGSKVNVKITTKEDIKKMESIFRSGTGYDVHRFIEALENKGHIILGGVSIEHYQNILAHSDGDVLIHALIDAILGACALNDIGYYFPPSDNKFKDYDSSLLLKYVLELIAQQGFELINIDAIIICERPKITPYRDEIRANLAKITGLDIKRVGVKATTTEKLGFIGREEGIAVQAVATVREYINEMD